LRRSAPHLNGINPRGGGRIVANGGSYSETREERKVGNPMLSAGSLPKWKKRVSLHFVHFVTFRMKSAAELEALFIRAIRHI
jgi:hypothetical protein